MVYQGSKNRLAKYIVPIIQEYIDSNNINTFYDIFVGGGNIIDKVTCANKIGSDINEDLISLLKYAQKDPLLLIAPEDCTFEHYKEVRADKEHKKYSQEYRALIGYMSSYAGRYFDGGYTRDAKGGRNMYTERLKNFRKQIPKLQDIQFQCCDYREYLNKDTHNAVFYLDPPYKDTKQYGKYKIDYEEFYNFCRELGKSNKIFISEYNMPDDFICVWEKERTVLLDSNRESGVTTVEKLFTTL